MVFPSQVPLSQQRRSSRRRWQEEGALAALLDTDAGVGVSDDIDTLKHQ